MMLPFLSAVHQHLLKVKRSSFFSTLLLLLAVSHLENKKRRRNLAEAMQMNIRPHKINLECNV